MDKKQEKIIVFSNSFDSIIKNRQKIQNSKSSNPKKKRKIRLFIYIILIILSWAIIFTIAFSNIKKNNEKKQRIEKLRQELQERLKNRQDVQKIK